MNACEENERDRNQTVQFVADIVQYLAALKSGVRPSSSAFAKRVTPFVTIEFRSLHFMFIILLT